MSYEQMSPLSDLADFDLNVCSTPELVEEIILFRRALRYCKSQQGDDHCWMDYRHLLMRFLPGYDPATDDVVLAEDQLKNCQSFIHCWQSGKPWDCLGGDKGKTIPARITGTLDCLEDNTTPPTTDELSPNGREIVEALTEFRDSLPEVREKT